MHPTIAQTQAALANLPDGYDAIGMCLLGSPGLCSDAVLLFATALDAGATARAELLGEWDTEVRAMRALAAILRDAAPRFAEQPPRIPLTAEEADASIRRRASAAGLATACLGAQARILREMRDFDRAGEGWPERAP